MIMNKELALAREIQRRKVAEARADKLAADLDYVAMMADVDIPSEEEGEYESEI